jgi:hypothetical protein
MTPGDMVAAAATIIGCAAEVQESPFSSGLSRSMDTERFHRAPAAVAELVALIDAYHGCDPKDVTQRRALLADIRRVDEASRPVLPDVWEDEEAAGRGEGQVPD